MKEILLKHFEAYPKMEICDAVKLLYQSEFGGGHMIANPVKSLDWIKKEWEQMASFGQEEDRELIEEIGGGICRVSLHMLGKGLSPETLNRLFVKTADRIAGTTESFEKKLQILRDLCMEGKTPFTPDALEAYLAAYQADGYPPISHSECYRTHYAPCYRVVSAGFTRYLEVFCEIDRALAESGDRQILMWVDGMCGSGKSTLGRILEDVYDCNVFHMDDFFLRPEQRVPERFAEPGGNVDYERFKEEILDHIGNPDGFTYQVYNCGIQALDRYVTVPYKKLNIIEGVYSNHPYFGTPYDLKFLCKISSEEQLNRILKRNGPEMLERFKSVWIPMENRYLEAFEIEKGCRIV